MIETLIEKLANNSLLALVIVGVLLFVIGAAGGFPLLSIQVPEIGWRVALAVLGLALAFGGAVQLLLKSEKKRSIRQEHKENVLSRKDMKAMMTLDEFLENNSPDDLSIKITVPKGFNVLGENRFLQFSDWLSNPIGGSSKVKEYPIKGEVIPHVTGLVVEIKIHTSKWYPQYKCFVQSDGTFSGSVWLTSGYPSAIFRFDILRATDGTLLKRFDVYVA